MGAEAISEVSTHRIAHLDFLLIGERSCKEMKMKLF